MPNNKNTTDSKDKEIVLNNELPTIFIDGISIRVRNDNCALIRLLSTLPEGPYEQGRFIILDEDLRMIIQSLCESAEYYPPKPKKRTTKNEKKG